MTPNTHSLLSGALDTFLLLGILITAVLSIFKAGKWFGGMVSAVEDLTQSHVALSESQADFRVAFDEHVTEENGRFTRVEETLTDHGDSIKCVHDQVARLAKSSNGKPG